jgi:hypothetical protein
MDDLRRRVAGDDQARAVDSGSGSTKNGTAAPTATAPGHRRVTTPSAASTQFWNLPGRHLRVTTAAPSRSPTSTTGSGSGIAAGDTTAVVAATHAHLHRARDELLAVVRGGAA